MKHIILVLLCLISTQIMAQNEVKLYKSYDAYINKEPEVYQFVKYTMNFKGSVAYPTLNVDNDGKKEKIILREYWGFEYKDILFRKEKREETYVGLLSTGKLYYWESAINVLNVVAGKKNVEISQIYNGGSIFLSASLDGDIWHGKDFNEFFAKNSETKQVVFCYKDQLSFDKISDFHAKHFGLGTDETTQAFILASSIYRTGGKDLNMIRNCVANFNGNFLSIYTK